MKNAKYLMWGAIPVTFNQQGCWKVAVGCPLCRRSLTWLAVTLLQINVAVEYLFAHQVEMRVPVVPAEESLFVRAFNRLVRPQYDHPEGG